MSPTLNLTLPSISLIIPAYNEARWLPDTLEAVLATGLPSEVIVVDDGSTDNTAAVLEAYRDRVRGLVHPHNRGKGAALATGLRAAQGEIVVFCDAHLQGLKRHHLLSLVIPLVEGEARAVLGLAVPAEVSFSLFGALSLFILTGQRAYFREDLLPLLPDLEPLGYGVETFLFHRFPREQTALVLLPGVIHLTKIQTSSASAVLKGYLRETAEIAVTLARLSLRQKRRQTSQAVKPFSPGAASGRRGLHRPGLSVSERTVRGWPLGRRDRIPDDPAP